MASSGRLLMDEILSSCVENFGAAPRRLSFWDRITYLRSPKPGWLHNNPTDGLWSHFRRMPYMLTHGRIVWGHIVQANQLLFQRGSQDCPAAVVYCPAGTAAASPQYLQYLARMLFSLKGTTPADPELRPLANSLTNEVDRPYGIRVPEKLSPRAACMMSVTFICRKHLPNRRLSSSCLPFLVTEQAPFTAMPLPSRFWPDDFVERWLQAD